MPPAQPPRLAAGTGADPLAPVTLNSRTRPHQQDAERQIQEQEITNREKGALRAQLLPSQHQIRVQFPLP